MRTTRSPTADPQCNCADRECSARLRCRGPAAQVAVVDTCRVARRRKPSAVWRSGSGEAIMKSAMNLVNRRTSLDRISTIPTVRARITPATWRPSVSRQAGWPAGSARPYGTGSASLPTLGWFHRGRCGSLSGTAEQKHDGAAERPVPDWPGKTTRLRASMPTFVAAIGTLGP
jgi:hypothetical protein